MPDEPQATDGYCRYGPFPGSHLGSPCPHCGHCAALHMGVDHCPVCELVDLNKRARDGSVTFDQVVSGERSINDYRAARGLPTAPDVHPNESVIEDAIRRVMYREWARTYPPRHFLR